MPQKGVLLFANGGCHQGCTCGSRSVPALEHVANRPIAHHVVDAMQAAGVDELILTGAADALIDVRACLKSYEASSMRLEYAICTEQSDHVPSLQAAAELVGAAPCIVHVGDGLLDEPLRPYVEALNKRSLDLMLLCQSPPWRAPLEPEDPGLTTPGLLRDAGIGVFGPGTLRHALQTGLDRESSGLADLAQRLCDDGRQVQVCLAEGLRRYQGNPRDLLEVNRLALDQLPPQIRPPACNENRIEGRVHIDQTAKVTTSVIVGPVVVGAGAEITNAYVGPYTAIGAEARIEGVEIERSIIAPGASVMHVGARLVSSVVGRGAHVFRDFSLPRAMRLRLGDGTEVALC